MPGLDKAVDTILSQGGVFAALFVIACAAIIALVGAVVYLYKQLNSSREAFATDVKSCEAERNKIYNTYISDLKTMIAALERSTLASSTLEAAMESRQKTVLEIAEALRALVSSRDLNANRILEIGTRLERLSEQGWREVALLREEMARARQFGPTR